MVRQRRYSSGFLLAELSVLVGALILGCTEDRPQLPTQSPRADLLGDAPSLSIGHINQLLIALFPAGSLLDSARDQLHNIQPLLSHGDLAGAQSTALHLADFTIKGYRAGQLLDPSGTLLLTTLEAVVQLFDALLSLVGLPPSGLTSDALGPTGPSGTSDVFGALGGTLATVEGLAGLSVPADAVSGDHLFLITRRDDLALQGTCLSTPLPQYPLCYDFSVFPKTSFTVPVTVVMCPLESVSHEDYYHRLVLAHPDPNDPNAIQFTTRAADPLGLVCTNAVLPTPGGVGALLRRLGGFAARLILPSPLYATHGGMGGSVDSFSPFIAVDSAADLTVQSVTQTPGAPTTADVITVSAVIHNNSSVPAGPFTVAFGADPASAPVVSVPGLSGGASVPVSVTIGPRDAGTYQDTVTVDAGNAVVEFNEANNTLTSAAYTVAPVILPPPPPF